MNFPPTHYNYKFAFISKNATEGKAKFNIKKFNIKTMKVFFKSLLVVLMVAFITGCNGKKTGPGPQAEGTDTVTVADTGYTGIKQYMSGTTLVKEVTFSNGVRQGVMKSFYQTGEVRQTFWYKNGMREDSSVWYYQEGQPFRTTPYKRDTIDGIQKQYYREGQIKAKIGYSKGLRTTFFEEYTKTGKLVKGYPDLEIVVTDEYKTKSVYSIALQLSDKSVNVKYFRGDLTDGRFDTTRVKPINTVKGVGNLTLKKTSSANSSKVGVIADILTNFGNHYLVYKEIDLPYNDLN